MGIILNQSDNFYCATMVATVVCTKVFTTLSPIYVGGANQIQVLAKFTKGSSGGCLLAGDYSIDKTNWFQEGAYTVSGSVAISKVLNRQIGTAGNVNVQVSYNNACPWFRIRYRALVTGAGTKLMLRYSKVNV